MKKRGGEEDIEFSDSNPSRFILFIFINVCCTLIEDREDLTVPKAKGKKRTKDDDIDDLDFALDAV